MKVTSLRYLDAKFHHPSLGASPPNRGNRISCVQNSRKTENRNSVNNSGIGILCSKNSNERLAFPAVAGLLVPNNITLHLDMLRFSNQFLVQTCSSLIPSCNYCSSLSLRICLNNFASSANRYTSEWAMQHLIKSFMNTGINKNLAIANRSRVSYAHNTLRASLGINITP